MLDLLLPLMPSTILIVLVWYVIKKLPDFVQKGVSHALAKNIESHKAQLNERSYMFTAAHTPFVEAQKLMIDKQIQAIDTLWSEFLRLKNKVPVYVSALLWLWPEEIRTLSYFKTEAGKYDNGKISDFIINADVEKTRPYLNTYLWALFFTYRALTGRVLILMHESLKDASKIHWYQDKAIRELVKSILNEDEFNEWNSMENINKWRYLQMTLENKLLSEIHSTLTGEKTSEEALAKAQSIREIGGRRSDVWGIRYG